MAKKYKIEQSGKKERWNILGLSDASEQKEMLFGSNLQILGNSNLNLEGCLGVLDYKDSYIKLKLTKGAMLIWGEALNIVFFEGRLVTVKGKISSVEFCV